MLLVWKCLYLPEMPSFSITPESVVCNNNSHPWSFDLIKVIFFWQRVWWSWPEQLHKMYIGSLHLLCERLCIYIIVIWLPIHDCTYFIYPLAEPLLVSFENTIYEVAEEAGQVEVCVLLTRPTDACIYENIIGVEVFGDNKTNEHFPSDAIIASEFQ